MEKVLPQHGCPWPLGWWRERCKARRAVPARLGADGACLPFSLPGK